MKQDELFDDEQYFKDSNPKAYNELESIIKITYGTEIETDRLKAFSRKIGIFRCPDKNHIYFSYIKERSNPKTDCGCTVCKNNKENHKIKLIKCRIHSASNRDIAESIWYCTECHSLFCKRDYVASEIDDDPHECSKHSAVNRIMDLYPDIAEGYSSDNIFPLEGLEYHVGTYFLNDEPLRWNCRTCKRTYIRTYEERIIRKRDECPYCTGEMAPYEESLEHMHPEIAIRWHKWNPLKASEVFGNSENNHNKNTSRGWFSCKGCRIPYYNTIENEIKGGYDCEYCEAGLTKELSEQIFEEAFNAGSWDRNSRHINLSRKSPIDFKCEKCGNLFQASPYERLHLMKECPHCLLEQKHLKNSHPELMSEWDFVNNEKFAIYPDNILETSNVKVFWKCKVCSGSYRISVKRKVSGKYDCPYCTSKKVLPGFNSFKKLHENDLMKEWDFESNSNYVNPDRILPTVISKVFWNCPVCKGTYRASVAGRISGEETCPYCANKEALPGLNSFMYLHKDDLMNEWDFESNVDINPDHILPTVKTIVYWNCSVCGGNYDASVAGRVSGEEICPYCNNKKILPGFNSFLIIHYNDLMKEWNYINNYILCDPDTISDKYSKKVWWLCNKCGYKYQMSPKQRVYYQKRHMKSCPFCKGLRQKKIHYM